MLRKLRDGTRVRENGVGDKDRVCSVRRAQPLSSYSVCVSQQTLHLRKRSPVLRSESRRGRWVAGCGGGCACGLAERSPREQSGPPE